MREWQRRSRESIFRHRILTLWRERLGAGAAHREALVMETPDWVNVVPITSDGRVLMVRQWRFGIAAPTVEIPGGMVEAEDALAAARRELEEETGHRAHRWLRLGVLQPNPALQSNRLTVFLATELERVGEPTGDGEEEIQLETADLAEIPAMISDGRIRHALVVASFYLLAQRGVGVPPEAATPFPPTRV